MAKLIESVVDIDLKGNSLRKARFENLAEAPSEPKVGQVYYNTTDKCYYYYEVIDDVGSWVSFVNMRQLLAQLALKQDVLTAGEGISIAVNQQTGDTVISSTTLADTYEKTFTASDFTSDTLTILKTEHGCGDNPLISQVAILQNGVYVNTIADTTVNRTNGTVTIKSNGGFDGLIVISSPYRNTATLEASLNNILYGSV